jgi:hypothetical protein
LHSPWLARRDDVSHFINRFQTALTCSAASLGNI